MSNYPDVLWPRCWKISGHARLGRGQRCGEARSMKDKYCSVFICRSNKQVGRHCRRTLAAFLGCHQTTLKCSSLSSWLCFYCCPECAFFQWLRWREKAMCTHLIQSATCMFSLSSSGVQTDPSPPTPSHSIALTFHHLQQRPTKTCFLSHYSLFRPSKEWVPSQ